MKRATFIQIIRLRSTWKVDKRKGDYSLPNGERLSAYIGNLVDSQMRLDRLAIGKDGDLYHATQEGHWDKDSKEFTDFTLWIPYKSNEICSFDEQERRVSALIREITG